MTSTATTEDRVLKANVAARLQLTQDPEFYHDQLVDLFPDHKGTGVVSIWDGKAESCQLTVGTMDIGCILLEVHHAIQASVDSDADLPTHSPRLRALADSIWDSKFAGVADEVVLTPLEFYRIVEEALVDLEAYREAQAVVHMIALKFGANPSDVPIRLIRRNRQVVPWSSSKIEAAVRAAFIDLHLNPAPAIAVAEAVTRRVQAEGNSLVGIEDVQDLVQEELMIQSHYQVAAHYILYRAERARVRAEQLEESDELPHAITLVDGVRRLFNPVELHRRVAYAATGLSLCLSTAEIEKELLRSAGAEMTAKDLKTTILLNAKTLLERDADFGKFAGRILLTYIYEEVLGWDIMKDGVGKIKQAHVKGFVRYLKRGVKIGRLDPDLLTRYDTAALSKLLDPSADLDFDYIGLQALYDRYLIVDKTGKEAVRIETPQFFWMRVAMGIFKEESKFTPEMAGDWDTRHDSGASEREAYAYQLYTMYKSRRFCSSTPTLFNSGTPHSQLSSCYISTIDDTIESIMQRGIADSAYMAKYAGGLGGSWTQVRGTGAHIAGTNGESQGVIPFLKLYNDLLGAVNQGGKRKGAGCVYLETWHNDLDDFLELRKNVGDERRRCHDMNTANWIPDLFMKRVEAREDWSFFRSSEVPDLHELYGKAFERRYAEYEQMAAEGKIWTKKVPALEEWKLMLKAIFETGHPWFTFKDACNVRSPQDHAGVIHSSNLCTEICLNTSDLEIAVCNLGSVVLENHLLPNGGLDHDKLRETINIAVRALDNVIDINFYPVEATRTSNLKHRPIGLGVMGLQNALHRRKQAFASEEAVEFNDIMMEAIALYAYEASARLAAEKGAYSSYKGSKWDRGIFPQDTLDLLQEERGITIPTPRGGGLNWAPVRALVAKHGMRNSNVLAIAPTATISLIMNSTPCIEPNYKNLFVKSNMSGDFTVLSEELVRDLKVLGLWDKDMLDQLKYFNGELDQISTIPDEIKRRHQTVFGVDYKFVIDAAARRGKWIDQSQSVNLFLADPDMKRLSHMYRYAWSQGLKTTYYLRTLQASDIEKSTIDEGKTLRGVVAGQVAADAKTACSIDAMLNGGECQACQ